METKQKFFRPVVKVVLPVKFNRDHEAISLKCSRNTLFAYILCNTLVVLDILTGKSIAVHHNISHNPSALTFISDDEIVVVCNRIYYTVYSISTQQIKTCGYVTNNMLITGEPLPDLGKYVEILNKYPNGTIQHIHDSLFFFNSESAQVRDLKTNNVVSLPKCKKFIYGNDVYIVTQNVPKKLDFWTITGNFVRTLTIQKHIGFNMLVIKNTAICVTSYWWHVAIVAYDIVTGDKVGEIVDNNAKICSNLFCMGQHVAVLTGDLRNGSGGFLYILDEKCTVVRKINNKYGTYIANDNNFIVFCPNENEIKIIHKLNNQYAETLTTGNMDIKIALNRCKFAHISNGSLIVVSEENLLVWENVLGATSWFSSTQRFDDDTMELETNEQRGALVKLSCMLNRFSKTCVDDMIFDVFSFLAE